MNLRIVVSDSPGLLNDSKTYKHIFEKNGFIVDIVIITNDETKDDNINDIAMYNFNLHLERINPYYIKYAEKNMIMPNQELFLEYDLLQHMSYILCKSKLALRFFKYIKHKYNHSYICYYTKFTTNISHALQNHVIIKQPNLFVHFAGKSPFKNTAYLIYCWLKNKCFLTNNDSNRAELHITCYDTCLLRQRLIYFRLCKELGHNHGFNFTDKNGLLRYKNLYIHTEKLSLEEYNRLITSATIAICPSDQEGYGHYINESRYLKTCILTMDAEPMNELVNNNNGKLIRVEKKIIKKNDEFGLFRAIPDINDMADKINYCIMHSDEVLKLGETGRLMYEKDTVYFKNKLKKICEHLKAI